MHDLGMWVSYLPRRPMRRIASSHERARTRAVAPHARHARDVVAQPAQRVSDARAADVQAVQGGCRRPGFQGLGGGGGRVRGRALQAAQRSRPPRVGLEPGLAGVGVPPCRRTRAGERRRAAGACIRSANPRLCKAPGCADALCCVRHEKHCNMHGSRVHMTQPHIPSQRGQRPACWASSCPHGQPLPGPCWVQEKGSSAVAPAPGPACFVIKG